MVSNLYTAESFYKKQKKGEIAKAYSSKEKLKKDSEGFYLNRTKKNGEMYKQRVKNNDFVYTRAETGVTKYSIKRDRYKDEPSRTTKTFNKATGKEHIPYRHKTDRIAKTTSREYLN